MKSSLPLLTGLIILSQSILSVSAAVPTSPPPSSAAPAGGYFSKYFQNLVSSPWCSMPVITGFDNSTLWYAKPTCQSFWDLMKSFFALYPGTPGQVVTGFSPMTGSPTYGPGSPWLSNGTSVYYNAGNVGIGTSMPAYTLDVVWKIRMQTTTSTGDTDSTVATKWYVDSQAGRILETITGETMTVNSVCLNGDCRTGWPAPDTLSLAWYTEKYTNNVANEDSAGSAVNSWPTWNGSADTCNGDKNNGSSCPPNLTGTCSDKYVTTTPAWVAMGMQMYNTSYNTVTRVCQWVRVLYKNDATIRTAYGTATIVGRDYSGSSESCAVSLNITDPNTGASCSGTRYSPRPSEWDDALCKNWIEDAIKWQNMCPGFKWVTLSTWWLSGNSGVLTIKYLGL